MVFGVFDGLHDGHRFFLREAANRCDRLIVIVASPTMVKHLKHKKSKYGLTDRVSAIRNANPNFIVVIGDDRPGTWSTLKKYRPNTVFLGYDQHALASACREIGVHTKSIDSHSPDIYKSSLLNNSPN